MYDPPGIVDGPWGKRPGLNTSSSNGGMKSQIVLAPQHSQHPMQPPLAHQTSSYSSLSYTGIGNGRPHVGNSIPAHSKVHHEPNNQYMPYFEGYKKTNESMNQLSPVKKRVKESSPHNHNNNGKSSVNPLLSYTLHISLHGIVRSRVCRNTF
jgi:hypothetical protein